MAALAKVMAPAQFGLDENSLPAVRRKRSIPALDGLRAIAVGGVVFMHVASVFSPKLFDLGAFRGWYGVDLFFVLSGFLITWLLAEELDAAGTLNVPRFYGRRAMRLMPAYGTLIICAVLGSKGSNYRLIVAALPYLLTYMFNFWVAAHHSVPAVLGQVWSLSIEEQFYLVWPWILLRFGTRRGLYIALATIVAVAVYRTTLFSYLTWPHPRGISVASAERIYFSTDTRIDVIFIGCALALLLRDDRFASTFKAWATNPRLRFLTLGMAVSCLVWGTGARSASFWRDAT